ncbi:glycogen/starch synthase, ADP-glucose type family protein, partial [Chlamydia psittaci C1/97]
LIVSLRLRPL